MSFIEKNINWNQLIKFTKSGVFIADYASTRQAITERFKQIYGQDIDLSTTSADGIYVETICLIINNILQSLRQYFNQNDVRTATGTYLDSLCALSNVYRKPQSYSIASVSLTLDSSESQNYTTNEVNLLDKNGNIWTCTSIEPMVFEPGKAQSILVTCKTSGPVRADKGWIDRLVENNVVMTVSQTEDAILGSYSESDSELRARRNSSLGATGNTVLETMIGSLYTINGIEDVKVYNNDSTSEITALDGTKIAQHDVYVVLRQRQNIEIADSLVCSTIYEKLTPGIRTTQSTDSTNGVPHSFAYKQNSIGVPIESEVVQNVYWKVAKPVTPKITIQLNVTSNYGSKDNSTSNTIALNVINYMNNLQLSSIVNKNNIWNLVTYSDPLFRGQSTFSIESITIEGEVEDIFTLKDTYFDYLESSINISDNLSTVTIEIGGNA